MHHVSYVLICSNFFVSEHRGVQYIACLSQPHCSCPSTFPRCKHLDFLSKLRAINEEKQSPSSPPGIPDSPQTSNDPSVTVPPCIEHKPLPPWEVFQHALQELSQLDKDTLASDQIMALSIGASNLLSVAKSGTQQPRLYELKRTKARRLLAARSTKVRTYERTRVPLAKPQRGKDNRVVTQKRSHKQVRLRKDGGHSTILVRMLILTTVLTCYPGQTCKELLSL